MKFIVRTVLILCLISIGTVVEAASTDKQYTIVEEGWRSRKYLAVNCYDSYCGVDFTSLHREMSAQEEYIAGSSGKGNNVALVRFSILTESPSGGLTVYPNFYRLYSKRPRDRGG